MWKNEEWGQRVADYAFGLVKVGLADFGNLQMLDEIPTGHL